MLLGCNAFIGRILVALALIVQIWAPVGSSVAMIQAAFDPLVDIIVCSHDQEIVDRSTSPNPLMAHHGDACSLCQLVAAGGHAPPPDGIFLLQPADGHRLTIWHVIAEVPALSSRLEQIRGRAPPHSS